MVVAPCPRGAGAGIAGCTCPRMVAVSQAESNTNRPAARAAAGFPLQRPAGLGSCCRSLDLSSAGLRGSEERGTQYPRLLRLTLRRSGFGDPWLDIERTSGQARV